MQPPFDKVPGVIKSQVGYIGGHVVNPTYEQVCAGDTGHAEAIEVTYDPQKVSYEQLLDIFWHNINPTQTDGQFVDKGPQYESIIFYHTHDQKEAAIKSRAKLDNSNKFEDPVITEIKPATIFYPAEAYHQCFYKRSPDRYKSYKRGSGREAYLQKHWPTK